MNFLTLLPIFSSLIDRLLPDPKAQADAKLELMKAAQEASVQEWQAKSNIIVAEAKGESKEQRSWRPHLMYIFMSIIAMNYIIFPLLGAAGLHIEPLELPPNMWTLLEIGIGGYIVGRTGEKIAADFNQKRFFDAMRQQQGKLSQQEVDRLNKAIAEANKG